MTRASENGESFRVLTPIAGQKDHLSPSTHSRYGSSVRKLLNFLGEEADFELQSLSGEQIENYIASEKKAGLAPKTLNLDLKAFRSALGKAVKRQQVNINAAGTVDAQPAKSAVRRAFTRDQVSKLLDIAPDDEWHGLIYVGYYTEMRLSDVAYLLWDEVDLNARRITVDPNKRKRKDEGLKPPLEVPIHSRLLKWFRLWRADDQTTGSKTVFPKISVKNIEGDKGLSNTFLRLIGVAGIENPKVREKVEGSTRSRSVFAYSFHSLRATFNTQLESVRGFRRGSHETLRPHESRRESTLH